MKKLHAIALGDFDIFRTKGRLYEVIEIEPEHYIWYYDNFGVARQSALYNFKLINLSEYMKELDESF